MDEFVDGLLHEESFCDTALPRLTPRYTLEELERLEHRKSPLEDQFDLHTLDAQETVALEDSQPPPQTTSNLPTQARSVDDGMVDEEDMDAFGGEIDENADEEPLPKKSKPSCGSQAIDALILAKSKNRLKFKKKKKVEVEVEPPNLQDIAMGAIREDMSIAETNKLRISVGLNPLQL